MLSGGFSSVKNTSKMINMKLGKKKFPGASGFVKPVRLYVLRPLGESKDQEHRTP